MLQNLNFGNERIDQTATGFKFNDLNGNAFPDAGEPRIAGVWIYIDLDGDERIDLGEPQAQTDSNGRYSLKFPGTGTYTIRELVTPGFVQTLPGPARNNAYTVTLTGNSAIDGPNIAGLNFVIDCSWTSATRPIPMAPLTPTMVLATVLYKVCT